MSSRSPIHNEPQGHQLELGEDNGSIALRKAWEKTLRSIASEFNKPTFENFIRPLKPLSYDSGIVVLGAPSSFAREWAEKKYTQILRENLKQFLEEPGLQIRFVVSSPDVQPLLGEKPMVLQQAASPLATAPRLTTSRISDSGPDTRPPSRTARANPYAFELAAAPFNDKYTFDDFVVGKSNRLAHAGALAVAQSPGTLYNPLFLYGSPGLGKTHLMHAIANQMRAALPDARVAYVSGETFTNHYVASIRDKRTEDFRRAYRSVDVWLVDDIQTIASREQTKEEFFHTFNALYQSNRQIVITSDRSPRELRTMDERLRSRFECGLIADIAAPELETRMAILQNKAASENMRIPDEVIAFMASLIQSNIRALEGALIKLMAYASIAKSPVTKQLASDVLSGYFVERLPSKSLAMPCDVIDVTPKTTYDESCVREIGGMSLEAIIQCVSDQLQVDKEHILNGGIRRKDVAFARQAAMYLCRELTGIPMATIATVFGCKHHSAVAHAHSKMRTSVTDDSVTLTAIAKVRKALEYQL